MKNTILLYIRMVFMMVISLYTSRVVLQTLGVEDYGVFDVVGGVVILLSFMNDGMTTSTLRFLTFELGTGNKKKLNEVFVTSMNIHVLISLIVVVLAETVGLWFLQHKMLIPAERMTAAFWCYQLSILTVVFNIISYPYNAAILAHEKMSAFAYISILDAVLKLLLVYLLLVFSYDRLILYAILFAGEKILLRSVYDIYCKRHFEECSYRWFYSKQLFREMLSFAGWNIWGNMAYAFCSQGLNILLNIFFGPVANAARSVAVQVEGAVSRFATNFQMAINPQITKTYASGQMQEMHQLIFKSSRFTFCLLLTLCLPLIVETPFILSLWLKDVPEHAVVFVRLLLIILIVQQHANPLTTAVAATGRVRKNEFVNGALVLCIAPISYIILKMGGMPWHVYVVHLCIAFIALGARIHITMPMIGMKISAYFHSVVKRCATVLLLSMVLPYLLKQVSCPGMGFAILTIALTVVSTVIVSFVAGLESEERHLIVSKVKSHATAHS